jgi:hypothetical protein
VAYCNKRGIKEITLGLFSKNDALSDQKCTWPNGVPEYGLDVSIHLLKSNVWIAALMYSRLVNKDIAIDFKKKKDCTIVICDDVLFRGAQMCETLRWYRRATEGDNVTLVLFSVYTSQMARDLLEKHDEDYQDAILISSGSIELTEREKDTESYKQFLEMQNTPRLKLKDGDVSNELFRYPIENWYYFFHKMGDRKAFFKPQEFEVLYAATYPDPQKNVAPKMCRAMFPEPEPPYKDKKRNVFLKDGLCDTKNEPSGVLGKIGKFLGGK